MEGSFMYPTIAYTTEEECQIGKRRSKNLLEIEIAWIIRTVVVYDGKQVIIAQFKVQKLVSVRCKQYT